MKKYWTYGGLLIIICIAFWIFSGNDSLVQENDRLEVEVEEIIPEEENLLYGINVDDLDIVEGIVERNQTLSTLLAPFNVPYQIIDEIAKKSKSIFDVKKIAFNKKYTVLTPKDSSQAQFFIYEPNRTEFVVFNLGQPAI